MQQAVSNTTETRTRHSCPIFLILEHYYPLLTSLLFVPTQDLDVKFLLLLSLITCTRWTYITNNCTVTGEVLLMNWSLFFYCYPFFLFWHAFLKVSLGTLKLVKL
eukprot:TRINITY_DN79468_c0_g1_i1.p1 TRINITY_DN79468_c0_g1~~TRINITY_DN79468_c0_g1_i1.p1  ORF type:complete len:105 (-),score=5.82 TRINITY_DN79468_c0_g1_i1:137-451(-)